MLKIFFSSVAISIAIFISGCSLQPKENIELDLNQDSETVLTFHGEAYALSYEDTGKLRAVADEMAESFYWHSLPTPPIQELLGGLNPAWTPRQSEPGRPIPAFETESSKQLKTRIDEMYDDFDAYQSAYRDAHPDTTETISCLTDRVLCEQYVADELRKEIRELRNRYIAEVLDAQLEGLGEVELTSNAPAARIDMSEKPLILVRGVYNIDSLSTQSANSLFRGHTFMVGVGPHPCIFLLDVSDAATKRDSQVLNSENTAYCGIKLYSGFTSVANYLAAQR